MIKRLAFVHRADDVAAGSFAGAWRDDALERWEASRPSGRPRRLAHCVVRDGHATRPYDGVELAWFDEATAMHTWSLAGGSAVGSADVVVVEERAVNGNDWLEARWHDPTGAPSVVLIGLIERAAGIDRVGFRDYWWEQHRPLADALVPASLGPAAYVHDYVLPDERFPWDGIGEMYEASLDVAGARGRWFGSEAAGPLVADEARFMVTATRQVLVADHRVVAAD